MSNVELKNVNYFIDDCGKKRILIDNISYTFKENELTVISGPSGSGKTTLLYAIAGLLENVKGDIVIDTFNMLKEKSKARSLYRLENISIVFQNLNLFSFMNVQDNILVPFYLKNKKVGEQEINKLNKLLNIMKLTGTNNKLIPSLSGGEQQRVAIIRALIDNPKLVLCDEPTASLDEENVKMFMDCLQKLRNEIKSTFIIVTHDERVIKYADTHLVISDGKLSCDDSR